MSDLPATIPALYHRQVTLRGDRVSCYRPDPVTGRYAPISWRSGYAEVSLLSRGLMALEVMPGDRVGLISETRWEWMSADLAIVSAGAVTVGVYPSTTADECRFILAHSGVEVVLVEDLDQLQKLRSVQDQLPDLRHVILIERGEKVSDGHVLTLQEVYDRADAIGLDAYEARWQAVAAEDMAMLVYTSGTTGPPKGVVLTHHNIMATVSAVGRALPMHDDDLSVVFLPLAHSLQRVAGYAGMAVGAVGVFAERIDKIVDHMRQFHPTVQAAVPRIYEKIHARILARVEDSPEVRQRLFRWAMDVGHKVAAHHRRGEPVPRLLAAQHAVADRAVLQRIRDVFGGNVRFMISGAAPISENLLEFFEACGVIILEGYGLTETTGPATVNRLHARRTGSVGTPLDCCEIRIAEDGEVLIRGDNVFQGYFNAPEATAEAFTDDGWFRSGDIGELDADGFLRITDRKKELVVTAGGKNVSPANIESRVKEDPLISHCVVHGDRRKFLVALITVDPDEARRRAQKLGVVGVPATGALPEHLLTHPKIVAEVQLVLDRVNRSLPRYETIKYFRVLPEELTVEADLLTPTLKLKRRNIEARYQHLLDEMYDTPRRLREERPRY